MRVIFRKDFDKYKDYSNYKTILDLKLDLYIDAEISFYGWDLQTEADTFIVKSNSGVLGYLWFDGNWNE